MLHKANGTTNGVTNGATNGHSNGVNGHHSNGHQAESPSRLLVWSAADEKALKRMVGDYQAFYESQVSDNQSKLDDLAFTLANRRSHMLWRAFAVAGDGSQDAKLAAAKPIRSSADAGIAFVFTGQGAQYASMGSDLLKYPLFKTTLQQIDEIYQSLGCKWSLFGKKCAGL